MPEAQAARSGTAPRAGANTWVDWWCTEDIVSDRMWRSNMEFFVRATEPLLQYGPEDVVLDVGSGPGYLADFLKDRVREIHCLEISDRYIRELERKFGRSPQVRPYKLDAARYTDLSFLPARRFSVIVCQSVVQYYRSVREIESLFREVRRLALPGARFLVSDIPVTSNKLAYWSGLLKGLSKNPADVIDLMRLMVRLYLSRTGSSYRSLELLSLSEAELERLAARLGMNAEVLSDRLTTNENRLHLLIRF